MTSLRSSGAPSAAKWSSDRHYAAAPAAVSSPDDLPRRSDAADRHPAAGSGVATDRGALWRYVDPAVTAGPPPGRDTRGAPLSSAQPGSVEPEEPPPPSGPLPRPRAVFPWVDRVWRDWRADPIDRFGVVLFFVIATIVRVVAGQHRHVLRRLAARAHDERARRWCAAARATGMRRRPRRVVTAVVLLAVGLLALLSFADAVLGKDRARSRRNRPTRCGSCSSSPCP